MKFSGDITINRSDVHATHQDQRSKVNVTEHKTNFTPVFPELNFYKFEFTGTYEMMYEAWSDIEDVPVV